jgi:hypothetical protein
MWYQVSQLSQQSAFCFHVTALWQVPHGHRVILLLFCWLVGFVELFLFMPFGGNKLLLGTCTSQASSSPMTKVKLNSKPPKKTPN